MVFDFSSSPNSFEVFGLQNFITQNLQLVTLGHEKRSPKKRFAIGMGAQKRINPTKTPWVFIGYIFGLPPTQ